MIDDNKEWLTIKEASEMALVSQQAIYKRLNTTLKPYVKQVENKKYLNVKALDEINIIHFNQPKKKKPVEKTVEKRVELNDKIMKTIELLEKQLEVKDKQLETKDKQIQDLNDRLDQALKNASQSNFIAAQEKQKMLEDPTEEKQSWFKRIFGK